MPYSTCCGAHTTMAEMDICPDCLEHCDWEDDDNDDDTEDVKPVVQNDVRQPYWNRAKQFAKDYRVDVSQHIIEIMASTMMTRDNVLMGGGFVQAVIKNDLAQAIDRADPAVLANIRIIVLAYRFAFLQYKEEDGD